MARSMTGFGHAVVSKDGRELSIELKSVNHRFLDLALRMPRSLAFLEDTVRNTLGTMLARGHVDIFANYRNTRNDSKKVEINMPMLSAYMTAARQVEPLEQVIDDLKEQLRTRHILRMQQGQCSIEAGFVWSDLLTDMERTSDHCSNIAGCVIDAAHHDLNMHATLDAARRRDPDFREQYQRCAAKYQV